MPGIWLEPEAVGVRSPVAKSLVGGWGIGYLKLDHNLDVGPGTSAHADEAPGAGLLGHNRAYLDWLDAVLDRYPDLVLENCASGGMRMDYALLSRTQLQSTSDQQNPLRYPPIAAAAPTAVTPEQGAVWSYPLASDSLDEVAFTMTSSLLGRIHLSGQLAELKPEARALVREAVSVYKSIRTDLPHMVPAWSLGLPDWEDPWIALALHKPGAMYLTIWRRPGATPSVILPLPPLQGTAARLEVLYPSTSVADIAWYPHSAELVISLPHSPSALLLCITER